MVSPLKCYLGYPKIDENTNNKEKWLYLTD